MLYKDQTKKPRKDLLRGFRITAKANMIKKPEPDKYLAEL